MEFRADALERAARIRMVVMDVDGTMTDGRIYIGPEGEAIKEFSVKDGMGITMLHKAGIKTAIITGRKSEIVEHRAAELKIDSVWQGVKEALQGSVKTQTTLLSFVDEHISELSTHEGIDMSKSSVWTYRKIRKNLAEFIGEKYRLTDLAFGQLTEPFISDFHHYLLDEKGFSSGTITIYVSLFKKMCRIAFERGLCKNLLFAHYRVGTPKVTTPKALSMSDFIKIRDVELPEDKPRLSVSRDLFLFACYAGTAFIDTVSITKANVRVLEDGDKWLIYNRKKTGTLARVKLWVALALSR